MDQVLRSAGKRNATPYAALARYENNMSDWIDSPDGRANMVELLRKAGTPLEIDVARKCRDFCNQHDGEKESRITTKRAIYGAMTSIKAAREVDQSIQFDHEIELNDNIGVRLRIRVPIECKHRRGLEVFGFPRDEERSAALPMVSEFAGAVLLNQLAYVESELVRNRHESAITLISSVDKGNSKPDKSNHCVHKEQLIEKAVGSLFDFIRSVEKKNARATLDSLVERHGLVSRFREFCGPSGEWFSRFRQFVRSLPTDFVDNFNQEWVDELNGGHRFYLEASLYVPVVCLSGRLFVVADSTNGKFDDFLPTNVLMTGLRLKNWPGRMFYVLGRRRPEALAIICNPNGLDEVLPDCLTWYFDMLDLVKAAEPITVQRALLEGALFRSTAASIDKLHFRRERHEQRMRT